MMEVAPRTPADVKGGHVAMHRDGHLTLRESAQCPEHELIAFRDIKRYRFFNTNNIWVNLEALDRRLEKQGIMTLPLIRNPKTLDPRDEKSPKVFQIETAMGAAISLFKGASLIQVPLSRFLPVKKCNELMSIRSDRYIFSEENRLVLNPRVRSKIIQIDLDPKYYGKIDLFDERFSHGIPSLLDCESLTVRGDVDFEGNVTIKGKVVITSHLKSRAVLTEGTVVDEDVTFS